MKTMNKYGNLGTLECALDGAGVLVVAIDRVADKNSLDGACLAELGRVFDAAKADDAVKALVITGSGKTFSVGAHIPEIATLQSPEAGEALSRKGQRILAKLDTLGKPSCAAINGLFCLGGGLELAMACTLRVASEKCRLGLPEVTLGIIPGYGGTQRLPRLIGATRANWLVLSGEMIKGAEAEAIGLINKAVPKGEEVAAAKALLAGILKNGPIAVRAALAAMHEGLSQPFAEGLATEARQFKACAASADMAEGLAANREGRRPTFTGR